MRKLLALVLLVGSLASINGCGTDRVVKPLYTGPPQDFAISAVLTQAVDPGSRVFLSGNIVSEANPDSLVLFGIVGQDGHSIIGSFSRNITPQNTGFFLVLWIERPDLVKERTLVPLKINGTELTAVKANDRGIWWELGIGWGESGPTILTLRDDRPRLMEVSVDYVGGQGEVVSQDIPVRCKSTWSGIAMPTAPWGMFSATPLKYHWSVWVLKPLPGTDPITQYFRFEDLQVQRFYGCLIGGLEAMNFKNLGSPDHPWLVFEVRLDSNGVFSNPRSHDDRGFTLNITTGQ